MKLWQFMKVELLGGDDGDSVKNKMLKKIEVHSEYYAKKLTFLSIDSGLAIMLRSTSNNCPGLHAIVSNYWSYQVREEMSLLELIVIE
ncbi:hypothetical protein RIR_jg6058.t1 [Rhizophagus irregularis DAOM 181602=DAOM 197198]|uniref:Uncharacterized protein n=1 Tax=Rhizophagus irregularis (strain DAOM 181602 / DAOM 197198 / MUCL 43194) TaxID=747089 RepID=U9T533_RHIID|nr:hypothetical protein RIR_jg6058.t1 [Rhizophagus irregularis DAOM 181602=DAOM 197198]CAG8451285.1 11737_t:CDS:2 [Rhizophagus irregularis]